MREKPTLTETSNFPMPRARITPMDGAQRALADGLSAAHSPDAYGLTLVDLTRAEAFRRARVQQTGVPLTLFDLVLRAVALSFGRDPRGRTLLQGYNFHRYETVDIGVSIASGSEVAPVIVFRDAAKLSLEEFHQQRLEKTRAALTEQNAKRALLLRQTRFLPDQIRRALIHKLLARAQTRHQMLGTIGVSAVELDALEWFLPAHMGTSFLLCLGGIRERPLVVEGRVEARLSVYASLMIDQRVIHPLRGMRTVQRWRRAMMNPENLPFKRDQHLPGVGCPLESERIARSWGGETKLSYHVTAP